MNPIRQEISKELSRLLTYQFPGRDWGPEDSFEVPRDEKFGDLSTNIALRLAKELKKSPRALAEEIQKKLEKILLAAEFKNRISKVTVEGPGFINFYFSQEEITFNLVLVEEKKELFGKPAPAKGKNILLEFVSANPTGPLTIAHGRQAALGDSLAIILKFCGHRVTTEYYNNDEGVQIDTLGRSTLLRAGEILHGHAAEALPEGCYQGDYLVGTAGELLNHLGREKFSKLSEEEKFLECRKYAKDSILKGIQKDLKDFGVEFDNIYSQEELGRSGKVEATLKTLREKGVVYESEGAAWLRSTDFGDDKDRVLVKSDKSYTYLTPDIAYHHEKFGRGFDTIIDILGPDHHGYIARLKASQKALGHDASAIHVLIAQLVTLYEGSKQVRMSTRAGDFVTLREVLDEVGKDAGRFFFLMRKFDAHLDFDLALAKSQTPDNPVFYIQYAHARVESIKKLFRERGLKLERNLDEVILTRLQSPAEMRILRLLGQFEDAVLGAERTLEPYRLVPYLTDLAGAFHRFYAEHRVVTEDTILTQARMRLVLAAQRVIRTGLGLLGIQAPLKM